MNLNQVLSNISIFALGWLLVLRLVPSDVLSWGIFVFFILVAVVSWANERQK